jgi:hypothetical protein
MKNQTQALEQASIKQYRKAVRVPVVGANFVTLAQQAVKENHSHVRYLEALLARECEERDRHAIEKWRAPGGAVIAAPAPVPPKRRRPTGVARLHGRRGGNNQILAEWSRI